MERQEIAKSRARGGLNTRETRSRINARASPPQARAWKTRESEIFAGGKKESGEEREERTRGS